MLKAVGEVMMTYGKIWRERPAKGSSSRSPAACYTHRQ
jgi:hypothetical protein